MVRGDFGLKAQRLSACAGWLVPYGLCCRRTCCCLTSENGSGPLAISLYSLYVDGSCSAGRIEIFFLELLSVNGERVVLFLECGLLFPRSLDARPQLASVPGNAVFSLCSRVTL